MPHPVYDPPWSPAEIGRVAIQKIENGYLVLYKPTLGAAVKQYYAADMKEVGERVTACMVEGAIKGEK